MRGHCTKRHCDTPPIVSAPETSIWPRVQERIVDHIENNRSTIVFVNSRGLAEKLTAALNDIHLRRILAKQGIDPKTTRQASAASPKCHHSPARTTAPCPGTAHPHRGGAQGGTLRCVVATSSLELGIDMGHVDLVIQVAALPQLPPHWQRVGRAGHRVGEICVDSSTPSTAATCSAQPSPSPECAAEPSSRLPSPPTPGCTRTADRRRLRIGPHQRGLLVRGATPQRTLRRPAAHPSSTPYSKCSPDATLRRIRRTAPRHHLGSHPTEQAPSGSIEGRPGSQRLAVTSGGTIPDRGLFPVYLVSGDEERGPRRVGELDEEMVYESRAGEVITLGASSWRIEEITHDAVRSPRARSARAPAFSGTATAWAALTPWACRRSAFTRPLQPGRNR